MADDKATTTKKKIDLKARLGKSTLTGMTSPAVGLPIPSSSGSGLPPPDSYPGGPPSSVPAGAMGSGFPAAPPSVRPSMGIAPPPGMPPGPPPPPFAPPSRPAPPREIKPTAAQQTIKIDIGEEIHDERK